MPGRKQPEISFPQLPGEGRSLGRAPPVFPNARILGNAIGSKEGRGTCAIIKREREMVSSEQAGNQGRGEYQFLIEMRGVISRRNPAPGWRGACFQITCHTRPPSLEPGPTVCVGQGGPTES